MRTWIKDDAGNQASVEFWGSEDAARAALKTLVSCSDCSDCSGCCGCSRCSDCSRCSRCSGCSGCSGCYGCSRCSDCSRCSRCSGCYGCSRCSRCSGCYGCSRCSRCYGCSDCSRCSDCYGCYGVAPQKLPAAIPVVEDIHRKMYEAVSRPNALNMATWHSCDTTHCRAGWAVHLAGKEGYELEKTTSPLFAAMQIYRASGYEISPCRFYDSNEAALADMKALAALGREAAGESE